MTLYQPVRGTKDVWGAEALQHRNITILALEIARCYGYEEIATPIFEQASVFLRSLGETSDVVSKEMYLLEDRNKEPLALRPEGTAPVMRAVLSNNLHQSLPYRCVYTGPMFRYERPQKGRQRQFHQVGVECIGSEDPWADVEVIALAAELLKKLGVDGSITLNLSTLGDNESRQNYREHLVEFFKKHQGDLSSESQLRLEKNPLRILDSKDLKDQEIIKNAPKIFDFLTTKAAHFFEKVQAGLNLLKIPFGLNPGIVRGLDYYCHTAFEFVSTHLGAQSTVLGGGRYDQLSQELGGPSLPSVGWGVGIERLALLDPVFQQKPRPVVVVPVGDEAFETAIALTFQLRQNGILTSLDFSGNMGKRLKRAAKAEACVALLLGEDEVKTQSVTWRDMDSGEQKLLPQSEIISTVRSYMKDKK